MWGISHYEVSEHRPSPECWLLCINGECVSRYLVQNSFAVFPLSSIFPSKHHQVTSYQKEGQSCLLPRSRNMMIFLPYLGTGSLQWVLLACRGLVGLRSQKELYWGSLGSCWNMPALCCEVNIMGLICRGTGLRQHLPLLCL